jgi:hypothetical protein
MRGWAIGLLALVAFSNIPKETNAGLLGGGDDGDSTMVLVLLNMITQKDDPNAMRSLYPLLLSGIMGEGAMDNKAMYYLLLGAGGDNNMQQWLPLILNNKKKSISSKLLMLIFMQQNQVVGSTGMNSMFPLLLLNNGDDKSCYVNSKTCTCDEDPNEMLLYIMLLNGNSNAQSTDNNYRNFMFMMFNNDGCDGSFADDTSCSCDKAEGGIDMFTYLMMMQQNPEVQQQLPESPPQRAIDIKDLLKKQMFQNLGPEYAWMADAGNQDTSELVKFQLYQQMGIPPNIIGLLEQGGQKTTDQRFALIQWMAQGSQMSIETMSLMLGIEDAKQFYIQSMIEDGSVDPLTASLLLASQGSSNKEKLKEMLILAATGQIDPSNFATIAKPYVPVLPAGIYPGQELYFIHLEMLDLNTCSLIEPEKRRACAKNFGGYVNAEQCEVHPYCCYNPYFGGNNGKIKIDGVEVAVPWCYFNIYFVFHDQYKIRIQEADQFKGPQDCPGLFRYGLNLDPFMYYSAVNDLFGGVTQKEYGNYVVAGHTASLSSTRLGKLIHYRNDVGFPGITEFHCRAILGACWDENAGNYPAQYKVPQCYEEAEINDGSKSLNLYDPDVFKPIVPDHFRAGEGECDTNYFHISTLYYERRACTYNIEMIKYGTEFSPLAQPTREDCLFRLGCCFEDNEEVMAKYPFMPRCYKRIEDNMMEKRLFETRPLKTNSGTHICGTAAITKFITDDFSAIATNINNYKLKQLDAAKLLLDQKAWDTSVTAGMTILGADQNTCMFINTNTRQSPNSCESTDPAERNCIFWDVFDMFNKDELKTIYQKTDGIPLELQAMVGDLF